jgi:hypothetical protein
VWIFTHRALKCSMTVIVLKCIMMCQYWGRVWMCIANWRDRNFFRSRIDRYRGSNTFPAHTLDQRNILLASSFYDTPNGLSGTHSPSPLSGRVEWSAYQTYTNRHRHVQTSTQAGGSTKPTASLRPLPLHRAKQQITDAAFPLSPQHHIGGGSKLGGRVRFPLSGCYRWPADNFLPVYCGLLQHCLEPLKWPTYSFKNLPYIQSKMHLAMLEWMIEC